MKIISVKAQVFHAERERERKTVWRNDTQNEISSQFLHFWDSLKEILNLL
jgi:hypothetical protein